MRQQNGKHFFEKLWDCVKSISPSIHLNTYVQLLRGHQGLKASFMRYQPTWHLKSRGENDLGELLTSTPRRHEAKTLEQKCRSGAIKYGIVSLRFALADLKWIGGVLRRASHLLQVPPSSRSPNPREGRGIWQGGRRDDWQRSDEREPRGDLETALSSQVWLPRVKQRPRLGFDNVLNEMELL